MTFRANKWWEGLENILEYWRSGTLGESKILEKKKHGLEEETTRTFVLTLACIGIRELIEFRS
jgi:hypothetical protein